MTWLRRACLWLALVLALASVVLGNFRDSAPLFDNSPHVKTLDKSSFGHVVSSTDEVWVVDFYSPWCPHCRDFAPEWEKVAAFYADSARVHIGAVDCTSNHAVCAREKILGYPAMKLFHVPASATASVSYTGVKRLEDVVAWIEASLRQADIPSGIDASTVAERIERVKHAKTDTPVAAKEKDVAAAAAAVDTAAGTGRKGLQQYEKHQLTPADQVRMAGDPAPAAGAKAAAAAGASVVAAAADTAIEPATKPDERSLVMKYTRLRDAGAALVFALEDALFMGVDELEGERYDAALLWIDALAASFPLEANRAVFVQLGAAARRQSRWNQTAWLTMLAQWKAAAHHSTFPRNLLASTDESGWASCTTYTCGLWTLFHSMSVGVDAPLSGTGSALPTHTPSEVAIAIRAFIQHFFGCENCVKHFLAANPPSAMEAMAAHDSEGPQTLIVWLWRMHNKVNKVTKKGFWPTVAECPECYAEGVETPSFDPATLRSDGIEAYVRSVYAHKETDVFAMNFQANGLVAVLFSSMEGFGTLLTAAAFLVVCGGVLRTQSHRFAEFQYKFARTHVPRSVAAKRCS